LSPLLTSSFFEIFGKVFEAKFFIYLKNVIIMIKAKLFKNMKDRSKILKGFTLTELMIAIFILSLGIYAVILMFPLGIRMIKFSQMATQAFELAQKKMEETISNSYSSIPVGTVSENPLPAPFNAFRRETIVAYVDPNSNLSETSIDKDIKKITVKVYWKSLLTMTEKKCSTYYFNK
jgi:prepilin-type N-terminal cleavage/methylation domain-containing protein